MYLQELAAELVMHVYRQCSSVIDVLNLSRTCRRMHQLLPASDKISILAQAIDKELGPLQDIIQVITFNESQSAHVIRSPPLSYALLRQSIRVGKIAQSYEDLYPSYRWNSNYVNRRALTTEERYHLRRAIYRHWLYAKAFHNRAHPRSTRLLPAVVAERCQLLRVWTTEELVEIEDVRGMLEDIVATRICPSIGEVQRRLCGSSFAWERQPWNIRRKPDQSSLMQSLYHDARDNFTCNAKTDTYDYLGEGWGDDISNYYVVQSFLKLDPAQIMWLFSNANCRSDVEAFVRELGEDWFMDNGATLLDTIMLVLHSRGLELEYVRQGVLDGDMGVAVNHSCIDCAVVI